MRPGAARLAHLANSARRIPEPLLTDLAALIPLLDVGLIGDDISLALIDVAFCDSRPDDAVDFASAMRARLQRYVRAPDIADAARREHRERIAWWKMALSRATELAKWPAIVLTSRPPGG